MRERNKAAPKPSVVLATVVRTPEIIRSMQELGYMEEQGAVRVICRCENIRHANEICRAAGFRYTVFVSFDTEQSTSAHEEEISRTDRIWLSADRIRYVPWRVVCASIRSAMERK